VIDRMSYPVIKNLRNSGRADYNIFSLCRIDYKEVPTDLFEVIQVLYELDNNNVGSTVKVTSTNPFTGVLWGVAYTRRIAIATWIIFYGQDQTTSKTFDGIGVCDEACDYWIKKCLSP
jgi:hypothetical protein